MRIRRVLIARPFRILLLLCVDWIKRPVVAAQTAFGKDHTKRPREENPSDNHE